LLHRQPTQPILVEVSPPDGGYFPLTIFVDPWQKRATAGSDIANGPIAQRVLFWMGPLHTGDGFGFIYRLAVFLVGLLPTLFTITGFMIWHLKRRDRRARLVAGDGTLPA
jgi:uncharacterized iron-regulated membrane protein